jgi:hypothetical protein
VTWQYPADNFGDLGGGFPIPPGATKVTFWTRGAVGGERVNFFIGQGQGNVCSDVGPKFLNGAPLLFTPLETQWVKQSIDITGVDYQAANAPPSSALGGYFGGVIGAFGFRVNDQTLPALEGGSAPPNETDPDGGPVVDTASGQSFPAFFPSTITFYIDDVEWQ